MAAVYELQAVQNASRPMGETTGAAALGPPTMTIPPNSTPMTFPANLVVNVLQKSFTPPPAPKLKKIRHYRVSTLSQPNQNMRLCS